MLTKTSQHDFNGTDPIFQVIVHDHPRKFGFLQLPHASHQLAVSWRSDLIDPVIVTDARAQVVWLGVDQRVVCVSLWGSTLFSIGLTSSLIQIKTFEEIALVLCESEALAVNHDYTMRRICSLIDIPDAVEVRDGKLVVTFVGGEAQTFSL